VELSPTTAAAYTPPPLALLPSKFQDYVYAAAKSLNVDVSYILLPLLSSLGAAIGNTRSIILKAGFVQPPTIWGAIIGRSGARKSPALEAGCFSVMAHERGLMQQNRQACEQYENELEEWQSEKPRTRGPKPERPETQTCVMDDLTIEALADVLMTNPRGVLTRKDELAHLFGSFDQYKNHAKGSDVSRWLSLHTGVFVAVDRRTDDRHYRIFQPRVCITGGIQPKVLRRALTEDFFERGLPARFLFAWPSFRQDKWSEATIPDDICAAVLNLFEKLWLLQPDCDEHNRPSPKLLSLDGDAKAVFVNFYNECGTTSVEAGEHEEAAWCKLTGYGARLALVGQLTRNPAAAIVSGEVMDAACELARWFGNEAVRIYTELAETREQREQRELCEWIERRGGTATLRDTITYYWLLKNQADKAQQMYDQLVKTGRGKWEEVKASGRGRRTRVFRLLRTSASAKIGSPRGKTQNCADAEAPSVREITPSIEPEGVSVALLITRQMETELLRRGLTQAEINKLTPQQAHEILVAAAVPVAPIVGDEFGVGRL
jgi:hypothetical protein